MKRWLKTCVLTMLFLVLGLTFPKDSLAAETLALPDVSAPQGETVTMTLTLNSEAARSGSVKICYDSDRLEFVNVERGEGSWSGLVNKTADGTIRANFASTTPLAPGLEVCTLTFRITADTPAEGTAVILQDARLYDINGALLECESLSGTVFRSGVQLKLGSAESNPQQTAEISVTMGGYSAPTGGSFYIEYDSTLVEPTAVTAGASLNGAQLISNLNTPGIIKLSFAGTTPCSAGKLCDVTFRVLGAAPVESVLTLANVFMYDEAGKDLAVETSDGRIIISAPVAGTPKLQIMDAGIALDGSATTQIILDPQSLVCGGELTLNYNPAMTLSVQAASGCVYKISEAGTLRASWATSDPGIEEQILLALTFTNAVEGTLELSGVSLYQADGTAVTDVEICSGTLTEKTIEVSYDASTGTIQLPDLPEQVAMAFASVYTDNMVSACASGTTVIELPDEALSDGDYIKVFYLDSNYCPIAKPGYIKI